MTISRTSALALLCCALILPGTGCSSSWNEMDFSLKSNSGSALTTHFDKPHIPAMFYGKWDVNGDMTNTANGHSGPASIPSDFAKDWVGVGWKFEPDNVLKVDIPLGYRLGWWQVKGDKLTIYDGPPVTYRCHFQSGYLYLQAGDGEWIVLEKNKYFGF